MGQTVHAWAEDEDKSTTEAGLTAIADQLIETSGDTLKLRAGRNKIALMYMWSKEAAYYPLEARINAASYPDGQNLRLYKGVGLRFISENQIYDFRSNPREMVPGEVLTGYGLNVDNAGNAVTMGIAIIVSDGPIPKGPIPSDIMVVQATATASAALAWTTLTMTLRDSIGAGIYEMLGARVMSATCFAARFIFPGLWDRPAVIPTINEMDVSHSFNEYWGAPVKFAYPGNLPKLEILECTGSGTVKIEMYLRKVRKGLM